MIKAGVIGWPIAHSRSPLIHNYWLKQYGIIGSYQRFAVEPKDLHHFLKNLRANGLAGCNVTIPHKENAMGAIDVIDDSVKAIGALNTVYLQGDKSYATSTDGDGFLQNLLATYPEFLIRNSTVTILGAGGSAKAVIERLLRANVSAINLVNRTELRAVELRRQFGDKLSVVPGAHLSDILQQTDLLINTTSQGMVGQAPLSIDLKPLPAHAIVADIVYVPLRTELLKQANARGLRTVSGLGMLLHQAIGGFEKWFGIKPVITPQLYQLIASNIDPDHKS